MNERGCYCGLWQRTPAVAYTGSWCDYHYRLLSFTHQFGSLGVLLYGGGLIALGIGLWHFLRA